MRSGTCPWSRRQSACDCAPSRRAASFPSVWRRAEPLSRHQAMMYSPSGPQSERSALGVFRDEPRIARVIGPQPGGVDVHWLLPLRIELIDHLFPDPAFSCTWLSQHEDRDRGLSRPCRLAPREVCLANSFVDLLMVTLAQAVLCFGRFALRVLASLAPLPLGCLRHHPIIVFGVLQRCLELPAHYWVVAFQHRSHCAHYVVRHESIVYRIGLCAGIRSCCLFRLLGTLALHQGGAAIATGIADDWPSESGQEYTTGESERFHPMPPRCVRILALLRSTFHRRGEDRMHERDSAQVGATGRRRRCGVWVRSQGPGRPAKPRTSLTWRTASRLSSRASSPPPLNGPRNDFSTPVPRRPARGHAVEVRLHGGGEVSPRGGDSPGSRSPCSPACPRSASSRCRAASGGGATARDWSRGARPRTSHRCGRSRVSFRRSGARIAMSCVGRRPGAGAGAGTRAGAGAPTRRARVASCARVGSIEPTILRFARNSPKFPHTFPAILSMVMLVGTRTTRRGHSGAAGPEACPGVGATGSDAFSKATSRSGTATRT